MEIKKSHVKIKPNMIENDDDYLYWYNLLKSLAITMFEWTGMPDTVDTRYLELVLFEQGEVLFFKENELDIFLCLQSANAGRLNVYNIPTDRHVFTSAGYFTDRTSKDSVIIYNNYLRQGYEFYIRRYARKLANISRSIDVNVTAQKTPYFIICDENQRQTFANVFSQIQGNEPVIYGDKMINLDSIKVHQTNAPFISDKLQVLQRNIFNDCMTFLGINNANQDKKERLVESEIDANDEQVQQARYIMLTAREEACKQINKMFGLNIGVKFRNQASNIDDGEINTNEDLEESESDKSE